MKKGGRRLNLRLLTLFVREARYVMDMVSYLLSEGLEPVIFTKKVDKNIKDFLDNVFFIF